MGAMKQRAIEIQEQRFDDEPNEDDMVIAVLDEAIASHNLYVERLKFIGSYMNINFSGSSIIAEHVSQMSTNAQSDIAFLVSCRNIIKGVKK